MRLRDAMLSSALQQNATLVVSFATGIVIAHLLAPREVGSYSVAFAGMSVLATLKDQAFGSYILTAPGLDDALLKTAFGLSLAVAACISAGFFALSFPLSHFYQDVALGGAMRILAVAQFGPALAFPATMRLMRAMRFGSLLAIGLLAVIAQSVVSITLAVLGYGAAALAWGYLASTFVMAATTIACQLDTVALRPSLAGARHLLAFGAWTSATLLVGNATMSAPPLMIGRASGMADAALFSRAQNLVSLVNGLFGGLRPLLPSLGEREAQGAALAPIYLRLVEAVTGLAWPAYAVLAIWGEPLVRAIYGEAWSAAGTMMAPIAIAHALTLAVAAKYDILIVKRRQRLLFACELAIFVFAILALEFGLMIGVEAAVWSLVVSSVFFVVCYVTVLKTVVEFAPTTLFKVWGRSLILTLAVIPAPLVFRHLASDRPIEIMVGFAVSSAISGVIWIAGAMLVRHELWVQISGLLRSASLSSRFAAFPGIRLRPNETEQG